MSAGESGVKEMPGGHIPQVFARGMVVKSIAGRDRNRLLVVTDVTQTHVLVVDGKERPIKRPKRKNLRHIIKTGIFMPNEMLRFNNPLRKALNRLAETEPKPTQATEGGAECPNRI